MTEPAAPPPRHRTVPNHGPKPDGREPVSGVILIDKPVGPTSHDVVDEVRRLCNERRVGHTGTLDPAASGLLMVLVGRATKLATFLTGLDKTYLATVKFGQTSDTGDAEGVLTPIGDPATLTEARVRTVVEALTGLRSQEIPAYAAVRTQGRRRYEMARNGEDVPRMDRAIEIHESEFVAFAGDAAIIRVRCSSGTYIRSIAEHLGRETGCGAHLAALRREQIGAWHVRQSQTLDVLRALRADGRSIVPQPIEAYLPFPRVVLTDDAVVGVGHGKPIHPRHVVEVHGDFHHGDLIAISDTRSRVVAIAEALLDADTLGTASAAQDLFQYRRVLI